MTYSFFLIMVKAKNSNFLRNLKENNNIFNLLYRKIIKVVLINLKLNIISTLFKLSSYH